QRRAIANSEAHHQWAEPRYSVRAMASESGWDRRSRASSSLVVLAILAISTRASCFIRVLARAPRCPIASHATRENASTFALEKRRHRANATRKLIHNSARRIVRRLD